MKTILFPTDLFDQTGSTFAYLRLMARTWNARVVLLHVHQPLLVDTTLPTFADPGVGTQATLDLETISQSHLTMLVDQLRTDGINAEGEWRMGAVEESVLEAATTYKPDLLITQHATMATFFDRLAGNAADEVVRHASCPVLFIPDQESHVPVVAKPFREVVYVLQQNITQQMATEQTAAFVEAFDAHVTVISPEQIDETKPDLFVIQRWETGFLSGLLGTDPTEKLLAQAVVPVLVHHEVKDN